MEPKVEEVKAEEAKVDETVKTESEDQISLKALEKIKDFFMPKKEIPKEEDIEKLVSERAQEMLEKKITEVLPKAKKAKETELDTKIAAVEQKEKDLQLEKDLEKVSDTYKEFVKFQAEKKEMSIDDYLKDNKQYLKDQKVVQTKFEQSAGNGVKLSDADASLHKLYKEAGIF